MVLKYPSMLPPHRPVLSGKMEAGITMTKMENLQKDGIRQNPGPDITSEKQVQQSPESLQ